MISPLMTGMLHAQLGMWAYLSQKREDTKPKPIHPLPVWRVFEHTRIFVFTLEDGEPMAMKF